MKVYDPDTIRRSCLKNAALERPTEFSNKAKGAVRILYNAELRRLPGMIDVDGARVLVWGYVLCPEDKPFKPLHTKDLTPQQFNALGLWASERGQDGNYHMRPSFPEEISWIYTKARVAQTATEVAAGQLTFGDVLDKYKSFPYPIEINDTNARLPADIPDMVSECLKQGGDVSGDENQPCAVQAARPQSQAETEAFNLGF